MNQGNQQRSEERLPFLQVDDAVLERMLRMVNMPRRAMLHTTGIHQVD